MIKSSLGISEPGKNSDWSMQLFRDLLLIRTAEEFIIRHYPEDEMKSPMHMSMGQEAVSVGVCAALGDDVNVFNSYRSHAPYLAHTGDVEGFFMELYGRADGHAGGKAGSTHLSNIDAGHLCSTAIVASGIPVAMGAAFASKVLGTGRIPVTFFGDGAIDEGNFWESLNIACTMRLPMVFVCEDNDLAVHTNKATRHGYRSVCDVVRQFDCVVDSDDSNDVERIFSITAQTALEARRRRRPAFLLFHCYRYLEHVGIATDFHDGYRDEADYIRFRKEKDCIAIQRKRVADKGIPEKDIATAEAEVERRVKCAVEMAKQSTIPAPEDLYKGVFHEAD